MAAPRTVINVQPAIRHMRKEFRELTGKEFSLGVARALNRVAATARTRVIKDIARQYQIPQHFIKPKGGRKNASRIYVRRAGTKDMSSRRMREKGLQAAIVAAGFPIDLRFFDPRQEKTGVSIKVMGSRQIIRGAFMGTVKAGKSSSHTNVFARGNYGGRGFQFRKGPGKKAGYRMHNGKKQWTDLPITKMVGVSIPAVFGQDERINTIANIVERDFGKRLEHELSFIRLNPQPRPSASTGMRPSVR